jgi:hypothetical protein
MIYPNDANGDVLRRLEAEGDDLSRPRNIDFIVVFRGKNPAEEFARHFRSLGHQVSVEANETDREFPWDVVVVQHMLPSHAEISKFEKHLQSAADTWGGQNDGWGCISQRR